MWHASGEWCMFLHNERGHQCLRVLAVNLEGHVGFIYIRTMNLASSSSSSFASSSDEKRNSCPDIFMAFYIPRKTQQSDRYIFVPGFLSLDNPCTLFHLRCVLLHDMPMHTLLYVPAWIIIDIIDISIENTVFEGVSRNTCLLDKTTSYIVVLFVVSLGTTIRCITNDTLLSRVETLIFISRCLYRYVYLHLRIVMIDHKVVGSCHHGRKKSPFFALHEALSSLSRVNERVALVQ
jgi:hypothetical protein